MWILIQYFLVTLFYFVLSSVLAFFILYFIYRKETITVKNKVYLYLWIIILFVWLVTIWFFKMNHITMKNYQENIEKFCWYSSEISHNLSKNIEKDSLKKLIEKCNEKRENYIKYKKEIEEHIKIMDVIYWIK